MNDLLKQYIESHDYVAIADRAATWIADWFQQNGPKSPAVIGVSGGKDSSVVTALCVKALGKDRVFGVMMPNGTQSDIDVSRRLIAHLGIRGMELNIAAGYNGTFDAIKNATYVGPDGPAVSLSRQAEINLGPRLRMASVYAVSQCLDGRVSNNSNRSEKYVGYSTRYGDNVGDFAPLANLTATEVSLVGEALGLPTEFTRKAPSDGLSGHTDEDAMGFTYEALDTYLLTGTCPDSEALEKIERRHKANLFKCLPMPEFRL